MCYSPSWTALPTSPITWGTLRPRNQPRFWAPRCCAQIPRACLLKNKANDWLRRLIRFFIHWLKKESDQTPQPVVCFVLQQTRPRYLRAAAWRPDTEGVFAEEQSKRLVAAFD